MQRSKKRVSRKQNRVSKIYKQPNSTVFNINVESAMTLRILNAGNTVFCVESSNLAYRNVSDILTSATSFTEMTSRFSMYRINSLKIECRSVHDPSTVNIFEYILFGLGFFPATTSAAIGSSQVMNYDKSLIMSTNQAIMSRKQTFYNNYFEGTGSGGYGTWNSSGAASSLTGTIQIGNYTPGANAASQFNVAVARIIFNITFKEKQLTA